MFEIQHPDVETLFVCVTNMKPSCIISVVHKMPPVKVTLSRAHPYH